MKKICPVCKEEFEGNRKYCSQKCRDADREIVSVVCSVCGKVYFKRNHKRKNELQPNICRSCICRAINLRKEPSLKTKFRGRFGRDKNGLSWKIQRRLAWERDNYTCQICGKTEFFDSKQVKTKPDVHHKIPYRVSGSHDLDNLICVCSSCHKKLDNELLKIYKKDSEIQIEKKKRITTHKDGSLVKHCSVCGVSEVERELIDGICRKCRQEMVLKTKGTKKEISEKCKVPLRTVYELLKNSGG